MIKPPIVVDASGTLLVFHSLADAEASLPPAAVQNGDFRAAYDAQGRLLRVQVRIDEHRILGLFRRVSERTQIIESEHIPTHESVLRALLLRFICPPSTAATPSPANPLDGLIAITAPHYSA